MADVKITALTAISANPVNPATFPMPMVDLLDTSMAASGTTKKVTVNQILGAGGTATLASATITGDLTVDTNVLKVDSLNNRVGINQASPSHPFQIGTTGLIFDSSGNLGLGVTPSAWGAGYKALQFGQSASVSGFSSVELAVFGSNCYFDTTDSRWERITSGYSSQYYQTNGTHVWRIAGTAGANTDCTFTQAMTLDASGNLLVGPTSANANGGVLQLKSGITFPATQVASSDANTLDDYEEGTWTGTLAGGTTNPTTPVTATGRYTKVGRQVSVQIAFEAVSNVGASGSISITGLPFANAALRVIGAAGAFTGATFSGTLISQIESSASSILFYGVISNSAWTAATHNPSAGTFFWANLTYSV